MALKLITKIKRWLEEEAPNTHSALQLNEYKEIPNGHYYDFSTQNFQFCLILLDLKNDPRVTWFFHRPFTKDERAFWEGRYHFKLSEAESNGYTRSQLNIGDVKNTREIKLIMTRQLDTMRKFTKDLRWVLFMGRGEPQ